MSLDPTDWNDVRDLGTEMVADMLTYLETVRDRPAWQAVPEGVSSRLRQPLPTAGEPLRAVYETFKSDILPYPTGNIHPRFWGWVMGTGSATGLLAEMLAATMNSHLAGYDQAPAIVERQVLDWLKQLVGFPDDASGVLVSGGTAANLDGLIAARVAKAGFDIRQEGAHGGPPLTVYASVETHNWIRRACEVMGLGRSAFREVAVDQNYRIDIDACRARIKADIAAGLRPFAIVGNAGTVNTGAVDDLLALRSLADEFDIWFHVDGAFGSLAAWSDKADLVAGQETADSLAFDLHKWGYIPYDVGVILTRGKDAQVAAFKPNTLGAPAYLSAVSGGITGQDATYFADRGLQLSRSFRALKVWMCMKEQGTDRIGAAIGTNIEQARYLERLILAAPDLELLAPVSMNIVCFRYAPVSGAAEALNALNQAILVQVQTRGIAVPSHTVLNGSFAIRVCITNHRSENSDFDLLVKAVLEIGAERLRGV